MVRVKQTATDKAVKAAMKRIDAFIEKRYQELKAETEQDFADARKKLGY